MEIKFETDAQGGFACGDTASGVTSYAYPTSTYATEAKRKPFATAIVMLTLERRYGLPHESDYDARIWAKLGGRDADEMLADWEARSAIA